MATEDGQLMVIELIELLMKMPQRALVNLCYDSDCSYTSCKGAELNHDGTEIYILSTNDQKEDEG